MAVKIVINGAISIVNAIAIGKGAALGISLKTNIVIDIIKRIGVIVDVNNNLNNNLIISVVKKISPKILKNFGLKISIESEVPVGYGLKSSSIISTGVALACARLFKTGLSDSKILLAGVNASLENGISITGAYDDACGCYYGGFIVTDNHKKKIIKSEKCMQPLHAVLFIPNSNKRTNVKKLKILDFVFDRAWNYARNSMYWNAMVMNGFATALIFNLDPSLIINLMEKGAIAASITGNGTAVAAVVKNRNIIKVKKVFSSYDDGKILISKINNNKVKVYGL